MHAHVFACVIVCVIVCVCVCVYVRAHASVCVCACVCVLVILFENCCEWNVLNINNQFCQEWTYVHHHNTQQWSHLAVISSLWIYVANNFSYASSNQKQWQWNTWNVIKSTPILDDGHCEEDDKGQRSAVCPCQDTDLSEQQRYCTSSRISSTKQDDKGQQDLLFVCTKTMTYQSSNITVPAPGFPQQSYICLWTVFIPFTMELRHCAEKGLLQYWPLISTDRATKLSKPNLPWKGLLLFSWELQLLAKRRVCRL